MKPELTPEQMIDGQKQWALVELYKWEHSELPDAGSLKTSSFVEALKKVKETFEEQNPTNIVAVVRYLNIELKGRIPSKYWHNLNNDVKLLNHYILKAEGNSAKKIAKKILIRMFELCNRYNIQEPKRIYNHG